MCIVRKAIGEVTNVMDLLLHVDVVIVVVLIEVDLHIHMHIHMYCVL